MFENIKSSVKKVVPDCIGSLQMVQFNITRSRSGAPLRDRSLIARIINTLPPQTEIILVSNDDNVSSIYSNLCTNKNISALDLPANFRLSVWAQDPYLTLSGRESNSMLVSHTFDRGNDKLIAQKLADKLNWKCTESAIVFEAGNIVVDEDYLYVGADTIQQNCVRLKVKPDAIISQLEKETGNTVVMLGPYPQPVGHLDAILTPLGNKTLVLADPRMGVELTEQSLKDIPDKVLAMEKNFEQSFFSDGLKKMKMEDGVLLYPPDIVGRSEEAIKDSKVLAPILDRLAIMLEQMGFKIYRMPFLYRALLPYKGVSFLSDNSHSSSINDEKPSLDPRHGSQYPCFSYNNVLLETSKDRRIVYVPQYGWPELDDAANHRWRLIGYDPQPIPGFSTPSMFGGQLRCMTKVLKRN